MDGPQDLGGKAGFGPIDKNAPEFRDDWERRQWALTKLVSIPGITIDWFRHALECMPSSVYSTVPYFQKWNANQMALGIDAGVFTFKEVVSGRAELSGATAAPISVDALETIQQGLNINFERPSRQNSAFAIGEYVQTVARPSPGHTRLPAYARAAIGRVIAHHGAHLYPDAGAKGGHIAHHLYTVEFCARDLWPDAENAGDTVCLDLWAPYLGST